MSEWNKWDIRGLLLAKHVSEWSKDPSTKVGAVIMRPDHTIAGIGYNGFPRGVEDDNRLEDREVKYDLIVHAEMNAVLNSHDIGDCATIYVWPMLPCVRCTAHILQTPINRMVAPKNVNPRWEQSIEKTVDMCIKSSNFITCEEIPLEAINNEK